MCNILIGRGGGGIGYMWWLVSGGQGCWGRAGVYSSQLGKGYSATRQGKVGFFVRRGKTARELN